jgi:hypothetical protein
MGPINRISDAAYFPHLPQAPLNTKRVAVVSEQHGEPAKPSSDEAYLSSCRPTRLSMEMMAKMRAQGGK